ncbi:HAMP domain-containing histidine kinase [Criibacterium bergeronii]|uniref:histidine kinase n=1 Tax=Criibacterium bergeronii TaxID=1871336 RepID=A0A552V6M1_9FIRM|nr:sensor histidine kinase [Criibacterium bergeronii]TRW26110.1 HAMP domain-containing histidine kinase [Criibacterium bergeronii]
MQIYNFLISKSKEFILFLSLLSVSIILTILFDIQIQFLITLLISQFLVFLYYMIISFTSYKKVQDKDKLLHELEQALREEKEQNLRYKNKLDDYFLTWIHQIKTPITSLNLIANNFSLEDKNTIKIIALSIENYTQMALSYLKLGDFSADMDIKEVDISEVVKALIRKYKLNFISTKTPLDFEDFKKITISDKKYLSLMLEQILNNALKFANGKKIIIKYNFCENYLMIKDLGIGIDKHKIEKIFDRGYSASYGVNENKSTGIGLYLVKQISNKLGHKVAVYSEVNIYTEFRIYFD